MNASLLFVPLLGLLATVSSDEVLTWRVAKGTTLLRRFESSGEMELQSITVKVDGQEQESGPALEMSISQEFVCEFNDSIEAVKDARPARFVRNFTKVSGDRVQKLKPPGQEEREDKSEVGSELEDKSVAFVREDSSWTAKWAGEEKADEALLAGLQAEVDFQAFLPGKSVSADDKWELEAADFLNFLRPAGRLSRKSKNEDPAVSNKREAMLDDSLEGKGTATYRGTREEDGVKVAVIALTAELTQHSTEQMDDGKSGTVESKQELSFKLEGEILWDAEGGFARSASMGGSLELVQSQHRTISTSQGDHELDQALTLSGKVNYKLSSEKK